MCGRVRSVLRHSEIKIKLMFDAAPAPNFEADWNKPPTAPMLVAVRSENGKRIPKMMRWGLQRAQSEGVRIGLGVPARDSQFFGGPHAKELVEAKPTSMQRFHFGV
jgi:putative SOS response-associated peptidase YedK